MAGGELEDRPGGIDHVVTVGFRMDLDSDALGKFEQPLGLCVGLLDSRIDDHPLKQPFGFGHDPGRFFVCCNDVATDAQPENWRCDRVLNIRVQRPLQDGGGIRGGEAIVQIVLAPVHRSVVGVDVDGPDIVDGYEESVERQVSNVKCQKLSRATRFHRYP